MNKKIFEAHCVVCGIRADLVNDLSDIFETISSTKETTMLYDSMVIFENQTYDELSWDQIEEIFKLASSLKIKDSISSLKKTASAKISSFMSKLKGTDVVEPEKVKKIANKVKTAVPNQQTKKKAQYLEDVATKNKSLSVTITSFLSAALSSLHDNPEIVDTILNYGISFIKNKKSNKNSRVEPTIKSTKGVK